MMINNLYKNIKACIIFTILILYIVVQVPFIFLLPRGRIATWYMHNFMRGLIFIVGIKYKKNGCITNKRPCLIIGNHISIFEIAVFAVVFKCGFFGKKEIESWPFIGWVCKKFGVVFIERNPIKAKQVLEELSINLKNTTCPMSIFPEGTTTNGAYVKQFKSTMFNIVENIDLTVQPVVIYYRTKKGDKISDEDLAEHYAYFDNKKQDKGPFCSIERSLVNQVFHIIKIGGFKIELHVLEEVNFKNKDRKEIAKILYDIVNNEYMKNK